MSWGNVLGDQQILPSSNFGVQDEIKFESGKGKKLRLLLAPNEEPYSFLEHCLEVESVENGQVTRTFRTIRCPKTHKNPNAPCPLCDGQQVRRRVRHACNVWDYDENKVMKLCAGESVFKPIATTMRMGVDILAVDWAIMKTGNDRNSTEYTCTNLGPSNFQIPADAPHYDMEMEYGPITNPDDMRAIVEGAGGNWDLLTTPPMLTYPTLAEALEHEMPNGKHKGKKFKDIWEEDKSQRGYIYYLALRSDRQNEEKACAQVILTRLGGADIEGVPKEDVATTAQAKPQTQQNTNPAPQAKPQGEAMNPPTPSQTPTATQAGGSGREQKIMEINKLLSTNDRFIKGGFNEIMKVMNECANGKTNIADFTDAELDKMLAACK